MGNTILAPSGYSRETEAWDGERNNVMILASNIDMALESDTIKFLKREVSLPFFFFFRAASAAYGGSQARGRVGATTAGLHHSHSNTGYEPSLPPTPQLVGMPEPKPTE